MTESGKRTLEFSTAQCFVVYDAHDGEIVHIHEFMHEAGTDKEVNDPVDRVAVRRDALRVFGKRNLEVMEVPQGSELKPGISYRVDPVGGELVELYEPPMTFATFIRRQSSEP